MRKQEIQTKAGVELLDFIREDVRELQRTLFDPRSMDVIRTTPSWTALFVSIKGLVTEVTD